MRTTNYQIMVCGGSSFRSINETLEKLEYEAPMERGFLIAPESNVNRIKGRFVHTIYGRTTSLDPDSLEEVSEQVESLAEVRFELDQKKGLVSVEGPRSGLGIVWEALETIPDVHTAFEDLRLNLKDLLFELQGAYKKHTVKSLKIRDYLAREHMLTSGSFKVLEPQDAEKIVEKYADQLDAFTLGLKLPDGAVAITVTRKGVVRASDDTPDEVLMFIKDLLPQFHEAEVETTEIHVTKK